MIKYIIKKYCRQEEYSPDDPANPCTNYPTAEYQTYADFDDHFVARSLPQGLRPFWSLDDLSQATQAFSINTEIYENSLSGVFG